MNKDSILKEVSETDIFLKFLKLSEFPKSNISSPFSNDKNPSFKLYENDSFKCHSSGNQGDCWQLVADLNQLNCKTDFKEVAEIVAKEFGLNGFAKENHFTYKTKAFEKYHLDYWMQGNWNVAQTTLEKFKVLALDKFEYYNSKKNEITEFKVFDNVLGFAYSFSTSEAELYIPKQEKTKKFFLNKTKGSSIFGFDVLPKKVDNLIICAGKKDALILNANGFNAISFRSENHFISPDQNKVLNLRAKNIFICYDNDISGINKAKQWQETYSYNPIVLPSDINDVADYFLKFKKEDFSKLLVAPEVVQEQKIELPESSGLQTIFHVVENYLSKKYEFRFNTILLDIEMKLRTSKTWEICNEDSLYIELQKCNINIQMQKLLSILKSDFVPKYNPINEYFKALPKWNGKDHIAELCKYISSPDIEALEYHLKKWLARSVKCMTVNGYFNKQALIFTDKGSGQNIGKSHFTKWLTIPQLPVSRSFEDSKKDNLTKLATNTFIILDELDGISKKDINALKALFSYDEIRVRLPYGRREETVQRIANFIGSTNEESFLVDPTGSVRWLVFHITKLDWNYSKDININDIWAQALSLAKDENFDESFNSDDVRNNEKRNEQYQVLSSEAELLNQHFAIPNENDKKARFMTSTQVLIVLKANSSLRINSVSLGRALKLLKFERKKHKGVYGYWVLNNAPIQM